MSFEEKCGLLGVAPHESGLCVETAAGLGGAIVPMHPSSQPVLSAAFSAPSLYKQDEMLARKLQQEEDDHAASSAAHTAELLRKDAQLAASLSPKDKKNPNPEPEKTSTRPYTTALSAPFPHGKCHLEAPTVGKLTPPSHSHAYHPGAWGNRFAALDPCPTPSHPTQGTTPVPAGPEPTAPSAALDIAPTALIAVAASQTLAARKYASIERQIAFARRERRQADEARVLGRAVLDEEDAGTRTCEVALKARWTAQAAAREALVSPDRAVGRSGGALAGRTEQLVRARNAFVSERDRYPNLDRAIDHMRVEREAARTAMVAEDPGFLPSPEPSPAYDPTKPTLRVVQAGADCPPLTAPAGAPTAPAALPAPAAALTAPTAPAALTVPTTPAAGQTTGSGGARLAYDPAPPGMPEEQLDPVAHPAAPTTATAPPPAPLTAPAAALPPPRTAAPTTPVEAPAPAIPGTAAPAAFDEARLSAFLAMRAAHPQIPEAVLLAFQASELQASVVNGPPRDGPSGAGLAQGGCYPYGPGGGGAHQQQHQQRQQQQHWRGGGGSGNPGG